MHNRIVNDLWHDPLLYTYFDNIPDRLLFDCGYMFGLSLRDIQKITSVFVSHTHFDHFMGFDHLLRLSVGMDKNIELFGPENFIKQVKGKLSGYSWNLCEELNLSFTVNEVSRDIIKTVKLESGDGFRGASCESVLPFNGTLKKNDFYIVNCAILDHKIPSLAFSVKEADFMKVDKISLGLMNLSPGPWLGKLRKLIMDKGDTEGFFVEDSAGNSLAGEYIAEKIFTLRRGKKVSYIVDTIFSPATFKAATELAKGSDELYCEASFLDSESDKAAASFHLTAKQSAFIAKAADVDKLFPIHLSKRYSDRIHEIVCELKEGFEDICLIR